MKSDELEELISATVGRPKTKCAVGRWYENLPPEEQPQVDQFMEAVRKASYNKIYQSMVRGWKVSDSFRVTVLREHLTETCACTR
jgi:hypothetical protein